MTHQPYPQRLTLKSFILVAFFLAACWASSSEAVEVDACQSVTLPPAVVRVLRGEYSDWNIVTATMFAPETAKQWSDINPNQCPGVISVRLRDERLDFVVNLVRGDQQQAIAFLIDKNGYQRQVMVSGKHEPKRIFMIYKAPPGLYQTPERDRFVRLAADAACIAYPEAGAACYYWDGAKFQSIAVSE